LYDSNPEVANAFNRLPTDSSIASAVESTTPVATTSSIGAATQISNGISSIVTQRQNANISNSGLNSGDGMFSENNLWIKPFGSIGKQNSKDGINGFDLKTYGLGFGADTEIKDNSKLGLAFFYTNGSVDTKGVNQKADLDVYTALVYGNVPIIDDKTNFLYQAGYSVQRTDTKREVFTGQTAEAKYNSKIASLDLKLMRDFQISDSFLLQPLVNTTYRHFTNPSYSESGAGALNLKVDKFTTSELIVGLGTLAHYKITDNQKLIGSVNVGYDLQNKKQIVTSAYQGNVGTSFDTNGIDNGRWSYEAGIGYELDINKTNNINISYDYQGQGSKFRNNVISAKYVLKF
ncbi:autotransporter outer membrane beta-barrel domain-containing protein, partial [Aliarcobacter cryaerophilus]|uniref:autotransporter outer membrane beta-barrel domain-containing protein n=1 Tax=Aliarcobacter cryaerophilus TaxID=28198 RepID=UPI0013DA17D7